jgi:hypothetical protein
MATTSSVTTQRTTKSGIDLSTFDDVLLFKDVPLVAEVADIPDALARLGNDNKKLLAIIRDGLQAEAIRAAREDSNGWKKTDENGKPTDEVFNGTLASNEVVNPVVLMFAKLNFGYDKATNADEKRVAKDKAREMIKGMPVVLEGLRTKSLEAAGQSEG